MTQREGNLEAPTRHPIPWREPAYYDAALLEAEQKRVFEVCHGCRRCVSLCQAFPTLFDLIDQGPTGELDGVAAPSFGKVVDQCYLCDVCYMTKCPYTPPHPWNIDFPHLMLRAKAQKFRRGETTFRDRLLTGTDRLGKLATLPVVVQIVNAANRHGGARKLMEKMLRVHHARELPEYSRRRFSRHALASPPWPVVDGGRAPGKVALFGTCYVQYNEPGLGNDLLAVLRHNEIPYRVLAHQACCGMPKLELGDLDAVAQLKEANVSRLAALAREGYALLTPVPSCTLMFKQELPLLFPEDAELQLVREAMFDPFEYFIARHRDGLLKTDFKHGLGRVSYHIPCHSRVQNVGQKTREMLELVPGTTVNTVERCAGHDGTWGVKVEFYDSSMKIGRPVFRQMAEGEPDYISSDCAIAARHIRQGMGETKARKVHPLTLLRLAYGLPDDGESAS
ncbi:MAG: Fe-S oxidoreductase [Burkholderiales bacterium]|nr:MAG: Fe-S oxidoreductase [Burkholderiales bacterium]